MIQDKFGQMIFDENDVCNLIMQGRTVDSLKRMKVDASVNLEKAALLLDCLPALINYDTLQDESESLEDFDRRLQKTWYMPTSYKTMDIAEHVLSLCETEEQLQRCGHELMLFQERDLFDLLKFLKYLVDVMTENQIIWGVGRGSSVASYVLFKLGVHRIDSLYYNLAPEEFLR
jgi:DNA polymerase III alpha subunit